jgi:hypothetical protein
MRAYTPLANGIIGATDHGAGPGPAGDGCALYAAFCLLGQRLQASHDPGRVMVEAIKALRR